MSIRVIHIVYPSFGYTFSGPTKPTFRVLQNWSQPDVELSLWGTDYLQMQGRDGSPHLWQQGVSHTRKDVLLWSWRLLSMLIRERRNYDLIHVHCLWWGSLFAPLVAHLVGKKAVYDMTLWGSDNPSALASQRLGTLKLALFGRYDGIIGISPALVADCQRRALSSELLFLPGFLVFDLPPLDNATRRLVARERWGIPADDQVLLFVGSMIGRKGVDLLVDLFIQLAKRRGSLRLILVGASSLAENPRLDRGFVDAQRGKLTQAGLSERVAWTGLVRDEGELIDCYLASDLFVFPTRAEGLPNVILEAMGCGLAVVSSYLQGSTDVMVKSGENGYLVEVDDLGGFECAVTTLLDDPALRERMGAAGRRRALQDFGFEAYCRELAQFYRHVAGQPSDQPSAAAGDAATARRQPPPPGT